MEASSWERLTVGETGSCSDGRGCAQEIFNSMFCSCVGLCSLPVIWPEAQLLTHDSTRDSWTLTGSLIPSLVAILLLCPGSWCAHGFVCALQESIFQVLWKFCNQIPLASKFKFPGGFPDSWVGKESTRPQLDSWFGKICWRRDRLLTPVFLGFPGGSAGKESACIVGDLGLIPGSGRSLGEGKGRPLQ